MHGYVILLDDNGFLDFEEVKNEKAFTIKSVKYKSAYVFSLLSEAQEEFKAIQDGGVNGFKYYTNTGPITILRECDTN